MTEYCRKLSPEQQEEIRRRDLPNGSKGTPPQESLLGVAARNLLLVGSLS